MISVRRPLIAVSVALLVVGILGVGAYAASVTIGQNELRPDAGQEVDRDIPSSKSKSTAPRIVPGQASSIASSNPGASGFTGLTFQDQRTVDNGNQTSDTPPDQGLCVGNGEVIEPVNTVFSIFFDVRPAIERPGVADRSSSPASTRSTARSTRRRSGRFSAIRSATTTRTQSGS